MGWTEQMVYSNILGKTGRPEYGGALCENERLVKRHMIPLGRKREWKNCLS